LNVSLSSNVTASTKEFLVSAAGRPIPNDPRRWEHEAFCYLTTTGRVSGNPHTIEIWFALDPDDATRLTMMAGGGRKSDWVRNLAQTPEVTIKLGDRIYPATARVVAPDEPEDALIRRLLVEKYRSPSDPLDSWGRTALSILFILRPPAANPVE
jgi:deazaflavin-dependent oxidoreductase (nitroreductase family)